MRSELTILHKKNICKKNNENNFQQDFPGYMVDFTQKMLTFCSYVNLTFIGHGNNYERMQWVLWTVAHVLQQYTNTQYTLIGPS